MAKITSKYEVGDTVWFKHDYKYYEGTIDEVLSYTTKSGWVYRAIYNYADTTEDLKPVSQIANENEFYESSDDIIKDIIIPKNKKVKNGK